ncbi:MAG: TatD DNase family protein [Kiritimatiellia bacterium]|jgi:TatD DNase family protein
MSTISFDAHRFFEGHGLFDSHCHFDFPEFDLQRKQLWLDCKARGITGMLIPGVEPEQWARSYEIAVNNPGVIMAAGLHPWWVKSAQLPETDRWLNMLGRKQCVAIGECGLDAVIDTPLRVQQVVFERHLVMALECELPLIIHVRQTHNETIRLLKRYNPPKGGVIHGFTGSQAMAMEYWRMGFYLGVGGSITYPRAQKTRASIKAMPLESLVLETDAPDMPLYGHQGKVNSPLRLLDVAEALAELRNANVDDIASATTKNSANLFEC